MAVGIGLAACGISSLFFGSMFVPVKSFDARDGMFAQFMMSIAILVVGFLTFVFRGFPGFYPLAMLGGASWCLGNATAIPIISRLGMAISILVWNTTNCLTGWAGGRFGLFGMKPNAPASPFLNYLGLVFVVIGGVLFSRVSSGSSDDDENKGDGLEDAKKYEKVALDAREADELERSPVNKVTSTQRMGAVAAALVAGVFYGMTFVPVIHMIDNPQNFPSFPSDSIAYVFSHYFGIFITSTILFIIYALFKKNKPYVNSELCLPGLCSGLLWAIAQTSFFVANEHLSQAVTFPIISMVPGCIASAWSIFYFKEIQGRRNFIFLGCAMSVTLTGALLVGLSKSIEL